MPKSKANALSKDLAALLAKYSAAEWLEVLRDLRLGSGLLEDIEKEVVRLSSIPARRPVKKRSSLKLTGYTEAQPELPSNVTLRRISADITARRLLPTQVELAEFYKSIGGQGPLSTSRANALKEVVATLRSLTTQQFDMVVSALVPPESREHRSFRREFGRWTDIIYPQSKEGKK